MPRTELRTEVEIDAPVSHVYRVLTAFEHYPEWNPFITAISGQLLSGATLAVEMSLPEGKTYLLKPRLTVVSPDHELRWCGHFLLPGLLQADHFFQLSERGEARTGFVQGENLSGLLLRFAGSSLTQAARGFVYMNQALKKRAESTWRAER